MRLIVLSRRKLVWTAYWKVRKGRKEAKEVREMRKAWDKAARTDRSRRRKKKKQLSMEEQENVLHDRKNDDVCSPEANSALYTYNTTQANHISSDNLPPVQPSSSSLNFFLSSSPISRFFLFPFPHLPFSSVSLFPFPPPLPSSPYPSPPPTSSSPLTFSSPPPGVVEDLHDGSPVRQSRSLQEEAHRLLHIPRELLLGSLLDKVTLG